MDKRKINGAQLGNWDINLPGGAALIEDWIGIRRHSLNKVRPSRALTKHWCDCSGIQIGSVLIVRLDISKTQTTPLNVVPLMIMFLICIFAAPAACATWFKYIIFIVMMLDWISFYTFSGWLSYWMFWVKQGGFLCQQVFRMVLSTCGAVAGETGSCVGGDSDSELNLIDGAESSENLTLGQPALNWPHGEGGEGLAHVDWKINLFHDSWCVLNASSTALTPSLLDAMSHLSSVWCTWCVKTKDA